MTALHGFVIGYLNGAYVLRVTIRREHVQINHRPFDPRERELLKSSLRDKTPVVVELDGARPVRVRSRSEHGPRRSSRFLRE